MQALVRMRVQSFIRQGHDLLPVEVELSLMPGLPQISFLGLPDTALRESVLRIRSAIREQGFQLPQAHQVLVQLRPSYLRKSSRGLDLAVAAALLWETGQMTPEASDALRPLYGELTLKGEVIQPDDIEELPFASADGVLTGAGGRPLPFTSYQITELKELPNATRSEPSEMVQRLIRPEPSVSSFPRAAGEIGMIVAAGEHPVLFAGPPGGGKSTLAETVPAWLEAPSVSRFREAQRWARAIGQELHWRPVVQPHHSITPLAMIGGGSALWAGEIARAHGGVLILDELLEFHAEIQEALREPIESGVLSISRAGRVRRFPADFLLLGTTNLCPCGRFVPRRGGGSCRCPRAKRARSLQRLTGPFVDRFAILVFTDEWTKDSDVATSEEIADRVDRAIRFRRARGQERPNARLPADEIEKSLTPVQREMLVGLSSLSRRRKAAVLRVARTLADLRLSAEIEREDLAQAFRYAIEPFQLLEEWSD